MSARATATPSLPSAEAASTAPAAGLPVQGRSRGIGLGPTVLLGAWPNAPAVVVPGIVTGRQTGRCACNGVTLTD